MFDTSKILAYIRTCDDPKELRQIIANARKKDANEVERAATKRLISLVPDHEAGTLAHDFWQTINAFEHVLSDERGKTVRLSRTRQKLARVGVVQTLADFALGAPTEGFRMLVERDMAEHTGEALVIRHASRFDPNVVEAAKQRLRSIGGEAD